METKTQHRVHGGILGYYRHASSSCFCGMNFSVFVPPQAKSSPVPAIYWLSGLTCTEDNFTTKAAAYEVAAELGLIVVAPDTSPRGPDNDGNDVPDCEDYDLGQGAGFYLDATNAPWKTHYHMYSYISRELPTQVEANFPADPARRGIVGHSMGGHGALTIWLKNPDLFASASALAPICAPTQCRWGQKAFTAYLGDDRALWAQYDATELVVAGGNRSDRTEILIDQGLTDHFLADQLHPHLFEAACNSVGQNITIRRHEGYDHSYFFISSMIGGHLRHHANILKCL